MNEDPAKLLAEAAAKYNAATRAYNNMLIVIKGIPKKKRKYYDTVVMPKYLMAMKNAENKFLVLEEKYGKKIKI